jgi:hypothetical protein
MRVKKYNKGGDINALLSRLNRTGRGVEKYGYTPPQESTRVNMPQGPIGMEVTPEQARREGQQVLMQLEDRQKDPMANMYSGAIQPITTFEDFTPIGDVKDIAEGVRMMGEEGMVNKLLGAGQTGAALALTLAPINLTQLKGAISKLRGSNVPNKDKVADYLEAISESGRGFSSDADLAEEMGLDVDDVYAVTDVLGDVGDEIASRGGLSGDSDEIFNLADELEMRLEGGSNDPDMPIFDGSSNPSMVERSFDPTSMKEQIGSYKKSGVFDNTVIYKDDKGGSVTIMVEDTFNPAKGVDEEVYSIDAFMKGGGKSDANQARVFVDAISTVPVGSTFFSGSMSTDSYPLMLKFLQGRKGRAPKAEVNLDYPVVYSTLNDFGVIAESNYVRQNGVDPFWGMTAKELEDIGGTVTEKEYADQLKAKVDKVLAEAGLPPAKIKSYTYRDGQWDYVVEVPYPHIKRTEQGFQKGGVMRIKKKQSNRFKIKKAYA